VPGASLVAMGTSYMEPDAVLWHSAHSGRNALRFCDVGRYFIGTILFCLLVYTYYICTLLGSYDYFILYKIMSDIM